MLTTDCIKEIAYRCNYRTTKIILDLCPKLNNIEFWQSKCALNFPAQTYLNFYSGEENYLLRKIEDFVLAVDFTSERYPCENILYEYNEMLDSILNLSEGKIDDRSCRIHKLVHIDLEDQFVILFTDEYENICTIGQYNTELEAINEIKEDFEDQYSDEDNICYMIIDMSSIIPYFWKYGKLKEPIKPICNIIYFI